MRDNVWSSVFARRRSLPPLLLCGAIAALLWAPALRAHGSGAEASLEVGAMRRTYWIVNPLPASATHLQPLVLLFHGGRGSGRQVADYTRFQALAERDAFLLVCPDGLAGHWNDGRGAVIGGRAPEADDVAYVGALLDHLERTAHVDPRRVYVAGISNGAMFAYRLAGQMAGRIAAFATVSGAIPEAIAPRYAPAVPVALLAFNGAADPLIPFKGGSVAMRGGRVLSAADSVARWVAADGCALQPVRVVLPHRYPRDPTTASVTTWSGGRHGTEVQHVVIEGGGHPWPGGRPIQRLTGRGSGDVDATAMMWEFFRRHSRP